MEDKNICFIGCGNMGRSLIGGLLANGFPAQQLSGADPDPAQREQTKNLFDIEILDDNTRAVRGCDVVVLAVKPQVMESTVSGIAKDLVDGAPLIISIAAGIRLSAINKWTGANLPVVRAMPNTPALIRTGAAAMYANQYVSPAQRELAEGILRSVGMAIWLEREEMMDAVTALSGSGPAYFFLIMEILEQAAIDLGLDQETARLLTVETAFGAAKMAMESDFDAATLRQQVTSPGGTTEQALEVLQNGKIDNLFKEALAAAEKRSRELAESLGGK